MTRGRKPRGAKLVEGIEGSSHAKKRLKAILMTITGDWTIEEACAHLGIEASMFHKLRQRTLEEAVESLEPRPVGRPAAEQESDEVTKLRERVAELQDELQLERVRAKLAVALGSKKKFGVEPRGPYRGPPRPSNT
jgi:hypothetical protein